LKKKTIPLKDLSTKIEKKILQNRYPVGMLIRHSKYSAMLSKIHTYSLLCPLGSI